MGGLLVKAVTGGKCYERKKSKKKGGKKKMKKDKARKHKAKGKKSKGKKGTDKHCKDIGAFFLPSNWKPHCTKSASWCNTFLTAIFDYGKSKIEQTQLYGLLFGHKPNESKLGKKERELIKKVCGKHENKCNTMINVALALIELKSFVPFSRLGRMEKEKKNQSQTIWIISAVIATFIIMAVTILLYFFLVKKKPNKPVNHSSKMRSNSKRSQKSAIKTSVKSRRSSHGNRSKISRSKVAASKRLAKSRQSRLSRKSSVRKASRKTSSRVTWKSGHKQ